MTQSIYQINQTMFMSGTRPGKQINNMTQSTCQEHYSLYVKRMTQVLSPNKDTKHMLIT